MIQKFLRVTRILAGNLVDFFQDAQGAQRDVFQISNRRGHQVQARFMCAGLLLHASSLARGLASAARAILRSSRHNWRNCIATVRVQVLEVRQKDGKNRKRFGSVPEKVSALRWQGGEGAIGAGDSVQRVGMVRDGLRRKIECKGKWLVGSGDGG